MNADKIIQLSKIIRRESINEYEELTESTDDH